MRTTKKLLSLLLALCMVVSLLPATALAVDTESAAAETTLQGKIDAIESSGTITLDQDYTEDITIPDGKTITLDLNGQKITNVKGHTITNNGTLIISDSVSGNGTIQNKTAGKAVVRNEPGAELTINNGTLKKELNSGSNDYYIIENHGNLVTINGGTISSKSSNSSCIENGWYTTSANTTNNAPKLVINGGVFDGGMNTVKNDEFGELTINDGTFRNTLGPVVLNWNKATINNGSFTVQTAKPVLANGAYGKTGIGQMTITGGTFVAENSGTLFGFPEGAQKDNGDVKISGGTFTGAMPVVNGVPFNLSISGGKFSNPESVKDYLDASCTMDKDGNVVALDASNAVAKIGDKYYRTLADAVKNAKANSTITLLKNVDNGDGIIISGNKNIVIDFDNHTYTVTQNLAGSLGSATQCFQLLKGATVTLKNGSIVANNADIKMMIQNYSNLTLDSMTLDATQGTNDIGYVSSNNCGEVLVTGNTSITAKLNGKAFDVSYWPSAYPEGTQVVIDTTGTITGDIEVGLYGNKGTITTPSKSVLKIENVTLVGNITTLNSKNGDYGTGLTDEEVKKVFAGKMTVAGGTFNGDVSDYVAPGMKQDPETGKIVIDTNTAVASVNGVGYISLDAAITAAKSGDTITLLADITELSKLTNGATTGNNISLLSIDKDVTIAGNNKTISITMPKEATNRSQAIEIGKNAQVTLDGVTLNIKGSASETDRGDAIDVYGTLNITNKSAITIENVNNGFVMQGGEVAHVNVTGGSTVTIKNVAGNASNGGNFAVKENSVVNISGCQSNGLSVYTLTVDNSDVNISDTGLTAIYGNELKFNTGANVTVERAGTKIPATGWNGVQFNAPVQVKDGKGAQVSMSVASGATVTVKDCVGSDNKSHNTIYLPANTTYTDNGTVNAEIVTAKAPENSFVVTLVSDGKTVVVQTVAKDTAFTLPKAPEKSNYTFNGWSDGSKTYKAGEMATIDKDTTFTAQWSYNGYTGPSGYAVKTEVGAHGKLTVSSSYATKGTTVTVTVTPDKGYVLSDLTVTDKNGNALTLNDKGNGKYTFVMPDGAVTVKAAFGPESLPFTDISVDAYYANAVKWAVDKGVTSGLTPTTFGPNASCTRAQMVSFLWRAAGSPAPKTAENPFTDVAAGTYYYKAVLWAVENDITAGVTETTFGPEQTVTRAQVVTFLYRMAGRPAVSSKNPFTDVASNVYYANAVKWAVAQKITAGTTDTTFSPNADCTRGQITDTTFSPNADCTRGQIVTFLYNHMAK